MVSVRRSFTRTIVVIGLVFFISGILVEGTMAKPKMVSGNKKIEWLKTKGVIAGKAEDASEETATAMAKAEAYLAALDEYETTLDEERAREYLTARFLASESAIPPNEIEKGYIEGLVSNFEAAHTEIQTWTDSNSGETFYRAFVGLTVVDSTHVWESEFIRSEIDRAKGAMEEAEAAFDEDDALNGFESSRLSISLLGSLNKILGKRHAFFAEMDGQTVKARDNFIKVLSNLQISPCVLRRYYMPEAELEPISIALIYRTDDQLIPIRDVKLSIEAGEAISLQTEEEALVTGEDGSAMLALGPMSSSEEVASLKITPVFTDIPAEFREHMPRSAIEFMDNTSGKEFEIDDAPMVLIEEGKVTLGAVEGDGMAQDDETPAVEVRVGSFYIDLHEVTNAQYGKFLSETNYPGTPEYFDVEELADPSQPVVGINWTDANAYAQWAAKRLPTEAEWELAAQGADGNIFPWGEAFGEDLCANSENSDTPAPIASFEGGKSGFGVHDMAGNVWEWCADWYDWDLLKKQTAGEPYVAPPPGEELKSIRGGSWKSNPADLRCSNRFGMMPTAKTDDIGFRCVSDAR